MGFYKLGARHSISDMDLIQTIHDHASKLGADCGAMQSEDKAQRFAAKYAEAMNMNPDQYAAEECNDVQDACAVMAGLASLAAGETQADEPEEVKKICDLMRGLVEFISGEIDEIEMNGGNPAEELQIGEGKSTFKGSSSNPGDYLIAEDKDHPTTWHLQVRKNGKPDHGLMGSAWAALTDPNGFRGNKYEGPGKQGAISKLRALYKAEGQDIPGEKPTGGKSIQIPAYIKSLHLPLSEQQFQDVLAVKFVGRNDIQGYSNLWGDPERVDVEKEFFTKSTDFWDKVLGVPRPLTWNHAQDKSMFKAGDVVGEIYEFGDDSVGRFYHAVLDRAHEYRKAVGQLIDDRVLGSSSDSAPQYVERVRQKNGSVWLKQWPLFAVALTDVPCEPRMIEIGNPYWKAAGVDETWLQDRLTQAGYQAPRENIEQMLQELQLYALKLPPM